MVHGVTFGANMLNFPKSNIIEMIESSIDEIALMEADGVREFEQDDLNYETLKRLVVLKIIELYNNIMNDDSLSTTDKEVSLIAAMTYLSMQNFVIHYHNELMRK